MKRVELKRGTSQLKRTPFKASQKPVKASHKAPELRRKSLKSKQLARTAHEMEVHDRLAQLGCVACMKEGVYNSHVSIHHVDGRTKPGCHMLVLPLCGSHHQEDESGAIAVHPWKTRFEKKYGRQLDLVAECMKLIGEIN